MATKPKSESKLPSKITILLDDEAKSKPNPVKRKGDETKETAPASKMKFSLNSKTKLAPMKISMSLSKPQKSQVDKVKKVPVTSNTVAAAFNAEEESDEEEMPMEAKMKMRNMGKDTPVPSGPNSFGKSRIGFSQDYKMYERKLMEQIGDPDKPANQKSDKAPS